MCYLRYQSFNIFPGEERSSEEETETALNQTEREAMAKAKAEANGEEVNSIVSDFLHFLNASPTAFHAVGNQSPFTFVQFRLQTRHLDSILRVLILE